LGKDAAPTLGISEKNSPDCPSCCTDDHRWAAAEEKARLSEEEERHGHPERARANDEEEAAPHPQERQEEAGVATEWRGVGEVR